MAKKDPMDLKRYFLFTYTIDHLAQKDKVRFYYALKGRDGKSGMLARKGVIQFGRATLAVEEKLSEEFERFFRLWKCSFEKEEMLISPDELAKLSSDTP